MPRALGFALALAALMALPNLAAATGQPLLVSVGTRLAIYALAALSLDLALGLGGLVSLGHAAFFGVGGYTVGIAASTLAEGGTVLGWHGPPAALLAWPLAMLVAAAFGTAIGWLSLRTAGVQFIMLTLAFGQLVHLLLTSLVGYGGDDGLTIDSRAAWPLIGVPGPAAFFRICAAILLAALFAADRLAGARFGQVLGAVRQSERRAASLGYAPTPVRLAAFVVSATGVGLAGAMWADYARFVSPDMADWTQSGEFMAMVILGGVGTVFGPVAGAAVFLLLEQGLTALTERWLLVFGPVLVLVVVFSRRGLAGLVRRT